MNNIREMYAQLSYQVAMYRQQMEVIKRETERINMTAIEISNAIKAIERIKEEKALIPIGGGALVKGRIEDPKILVPVGAQYLVEMEKEDAHSELKTRLEATNKAVVKLTEEFNKLLAKLEEVSTQLREVERRMELDQKVEENLREDYI